MDLCILWNSGVTHTVSVLIIEPASVRTPSFIMLIYHHIKSVFVYIVSRKITGSIIRTFTVVAKFRNLATGTMCDHA